MQQLTAKQWSQFIPKRSSIIAKENNLSTASVRGENKNKTLNNRHSNRVEVSTPVPCCVVIFGIGRFACVGTRIVIHTCALVVVSASNAGGVSLAHSVHSGE